MYKRILVPVENLATALEQQSIAEAVLAGVANAVRHSSTVPVLLVRGLPRATAYAQ